MNPRSDEAWGVRLRQDVQMLEEQLTDSQGTAVRLIVDTGEVDFVVVYGSVSRGEQRDGSDLDVYYETGLANAEREDADPSSSEHVFAAASGSLVEALRRGDEMAFDIVSDALVVHDEGPFRSMMIAAEQEKLEPAAA
jgi:predicted nucleotidyltransferase